MAYRRIGHGVDDARDATMTKRHALDVPRIHFPQHFDRVVRIHAARPAAMRVADVSTPVDGDNTTTFRTVIGPADIRTNRHAVVPVVALSKSSRHVAESVVFGPHPPRGFSRGRWHDPGAQAAAAVQWRARDASAAAAHKRAGPRRRDRLQLGDVESDGRPVVSHARLRGGAASCARHPSDDAQA